MGAVGALRWRSERGTWGWTIEAELRTAAANDWCHRRAQPNVVDLTEGLVAKVGKKVPGPTFGHTIRS